jgi:hypothetical protein
MELTPEAKAIMIKRSAMRTKDIHRQYFWQDGAEWALTNAELLKAQGLAPAADSMPLSEVQELLEWAKTGLYVYVRGDGWYHPGMGTILKLSTPDLIKAFKQRNV